jgi:hypothetical protein
MRGQTGDEISLDWSPKHVFGRIDPHLSAFRSPLSGEEFAGIHHRALATPPISGLLCGRNPWLALA